MTNEQLAEIRDRWANQADHGYNAMNQAIEDIGLLLEEAYWARDAHTTVQKTSLFWQEEYERVQRERDALLDELMRRIRTLGDAVVPKLAQLFAFNIMRLTQSPGEKLRQFEAKVNEMLAAYPEDVFPDPPPGEHGSIVAARSARAIRLALRQLKASMEHGA